VQKSSRLRPVLSMLLTIVMVQSPLIRRVSAAPQSSNPGQGDQNRSDPCTHLPDPPGNANGIDKQCPALGSSSGVAKGDFNGDGVADLAIGVPGSTIGGNANVGLVQVVYGSGGGLTTNTTGIPRPQFFSESSLYSDLSLFAFPPPAAGDRFGAALASGDFNHDGYSDLAIGVPGKAIPGSFLISPNSMGAIVVIYGSSHGLDPNSGSGVVEFDFTSAIEDGLITLPSLPPLASFDFSHAQLGASLAWGDFNKDGISDLVSGAPGLSIAYLGGLNTVSSVGGIWQILGSPSGGLDQHVGGSKLWTQNSIDPNLVDNAGDEFGLSLTAGGFNGNGFDDVAIGVPYKEIGSVTDAGMVVILSGSYLVGLDPLNGGHSVVSPGNLAATSDHFGIALAAGDFNRDGDCDLAIAAPHKAIGPVSAAGVVYVVNGPFPVDSTVSSFNEWDQNKLGGTAEAGDQFGTALAANDFNGDGYPDLAIGVPFEDVIVNGVSVVDAGEVDVIYSSGSGLSTAHPPQVWTESSPVAGNRFGAPLTAWNFGRNELTGSPIQILRQTADLAVGMPFATVNGVSGAGAINVIYGSYLSNGLTSSNRQVFTQATLGSSLQTGAHFGAGLY
jgi:hypothetical protein